MKLLQPVAFLLLCVAALVSCNALAPALRTDSLDLEPLVGYHDEQVEADIRLAAESKTLALIESAALLDLIATVPAMTPERFAAALRPVVDRYDGYLLAGWAALSPFEMRYLTRTSDLARDLAGLPPTVWPSLPSPVQ